MSTALPPRALTPLIGRERELDALRTILGEARLVTLTGAGGSGKTRLALELADREAPGAAWVELAPLQVPDLVPSAVLSALGIEPGSRTAMDALLDTLRGRKLLLVLDNCEHLIDACARLSETLLQACPALRILATSREALGVSGERAWLVPGLALPSADTDRENAAGTDAVRLFVERARSASAHFALTEANAAAIAHICRRLDGLPLAIELAAARVRTLPPEQLAARLDASLGVLSGGPRTAAPRHRTLRGTIQWSYDLLDARETLLLRRLSVFAGDHTLEAAERTCADDKLPAADVLDLLGALVDKSLVMMREEGGTARYYLLETVRQFVREHLDASGEALDVQRRHAVTYVAVVSDAEPHFTTSDRPGWVQRVGRELDNVRVALAFTREDDPALHARLAGMLGWFWYSSGLWSEGAGWLEGAVALSDPGIRPRDRASVLFGAGVIASLQARAASALEWLNECVAIASGEADPRAVAYAQAYIGIAYGQSGNVATEAPTTAALDWFRHAQDLYGVRLCLVVLSTYHMVRGDLPRALVEAEEGVDVARRFGLDRELAIALQVLATAVLASGDLPRARDLFRESLSALGRDPSHFWIARALQLLGLVTCRMGDPIRGARLLGAAEASREKIGAGLLQHDRDRLAPVVEAARQTAGREAFETAWQEGRALSADRAMAMALEGAASSAPDQRDERPRLDAPTPKRHALEVRALGPVEIRVEGVPVPASAWRYARPRELLLYLLVHAEGRTREQIGLDFWPDSSAMQVKNSFHVSLHHLRKTLGRADLVAFDGDRYCAAWEHDVWFDAHEFERAAVAALRKASLREPPPGPEQIDALEEAIALYRGDFLAEEEAGDWHLSLRERLQRLHADALLLLGDRLASAARHTEAVAAYQRLVAVDPLHEQAQRRLMATLAKAGDRAAALRQYDRFVKLLDSEMGAAPEVETTALYKRLQRAEVVPD